MKQSKAILGISATVLGLSALCGVGLFIAESARPVQAGTQTYHYDHIYTNPADSNQGTSSRHQVWIPADAYNLKVTVIGGGGNGGKIAVENQSTWPTTGAIAFGGGGGSGYAVIDAIPNPANVNYGGFNTILVGNNGYFDYGGMCGYFQGAERPGSCDGYDDQLSSAFGIVAAGGKGGLAGNMIAGVPVAGVGGVGRNNSSDGTAYSLFSDVLYATIDFSGGQQIDYYLGSDGGSGYHLTNYYSNVGAGGNSISLQTGLWGSVNWNGTPEVYYVNETTGEFWDAGVRTPGTSGAVRVQ